MKYELKDCRTGKREKERCTTVEITEKEGIVTFVFTAEKCRYYCPYQKQYNRLHSEGDACEILIGSDPLRKDYYEIEISAENGVMIAKMRYNGEERNGEKILLDIDFEKESFVTSQVIRRNGGYEATVAFPLEKIRTGNGEIFFNAYRIDTHGGKYLVDDELLYALNPTMRNRFHTPSAFVWLEDYTSRQ